jgi:hypothetical protein
MVRLTFDEDAVLFAPDIPDSVNRLLQAGVAATRTDKVKAESLLRNAYQLDRHCLHTYFALYKFHFHHKNFMEAEYFVIAGMDEAASQAGFPSDYNRLFREKEQWDMYENETRLFYLYCLKALAFIKLRCEQSIQAQIIIAVIKALDPEDRSGASVVMSLALALDQV